MTLMKPGMARLLGRLAINPAMRQAALAKSLNVTRSAVNQLWRKLEEQHAMRIMGNLDYGAVGYQLIFGWAVSDTPQGLSKFTNWLRQNPYTSAIHHSLMTQKMDNRVLFEALVPQGQKLESYVQLLNAFRKRPYDLQITFNNAVRIANNLNLGLLVDGNWSFDSAFRFEASIDAARQYAEILPGIRDIPQSNPKRISPIDFIIAALMETNYFITAPEIGFTLSKFGFDTPSERTLRRMISRIRTSIIQPYLSLVNIGLSKRMILTLEDSSESNIYKLLLAQSNTFPRSRVLAGADSMALIIDIPDSTDWLYVSNAISNVLHQESEMCTFIAEQLPDRRWLENVAVRGKQFKPSQSRDETTSQ
ncbi:MAG: hypothetical protein ACW98Y_06130 [Candidatus Thorarchaeota archaeon]